MSPVRLDIIVIGWKFTNGELTVRISSEILGTRRSCAADFPTALTALRLSPTAPALLRSALQGTAARDSDNICVRVRFVPCVHPGGRM